MITLPLTHTHVHRLDNGLEVLLVPDHAHPLVSVQLWVRAGSIHEEAWSGAGLAHLVEHMFFKGTTTRDATQISQEIQAHGGYVNAYTTYDRTVYWIDGIAEAAGKYLEILADMALNSQFDEAELFKEQEVIRREFAMDLDDPAAVLQHLLQETAFREHPLKHPIIGHLDVFDQVTHADLMTFVAKHYIPNQCFVVVSGDFDPDTMIEEVEKHFGTWLRRPFAPVCFPVEPEQIAPRSDRKEFNTEITRLSLGWRIEGENHPDRPALEVLGMILGTGRSSRLTQRLREELGKVSWIGAGPWSIEPFGLFGIEAECEEEDLEQVELEILAMIEEIKQNGVRAEEVRKAVRQTLSQALKVRSTVKGVASLVAQNWLHQGSPDADQVYMERLQNLTPESVQAAAQKYLRTETLTKVSLHPELEEEDDSAHDAEDEEEAADTTWEDEVEQELAPCEEGLPRPIMHQLSNGWRVILGKNPKLPLVSTRIQFMAGLPKETPENLGLTQVLAHWLMKGTSRYSGMELSSALEDLGGRLFATGDLHRLVLGADTLKGDEALGFELLHSLLHEATLPEEELGKILKRQVVVLQEDEEDPLDHALTQIREHVFEGGAYEKTALGTRETLQKLDRDQASAFLRALVKPQRGVISVFGDIEDAAVLAQIESWFGGDKAIGTPKEIYTSPESKGAPGVWTLELDKEQAVVVLGFRTVGFEHEHAPVLQLIDEACSDMGSRLFNRIREELGLAYYVGTQAFHALGAGAFYFYVGTDPEKLEQVSQELQSIVGDLILGGLTEDELHGAKKASLSSWLKTQQGNGSMADHLGWDELNGFGFRHFETVPQRLDSVTLSQVKDVMSRYFKLDEAYWVKVKP